MKRIFLTALGIVLLANLAFAAPSIKLDDVTINLTDTSLSMDLWILTDEQSPVDSATFTIKPIGGLSLDGVTIKSPSGWLSTTSIPKFGSTDFSYPANPITSDYNFATLTFSFDLSQDSEFQNRIIFPPKMANVTFPFIELADPNSATYGNVELKGGKISAVPIPSTLLLLGGGLVGVFGLRRKKKKNF